MSKALHRGFTLVELMIAMAVVAILTMMAYPTYTSYIVRSRLTEAFAGLSRLQQRMDQYYQDNRSYGTTGACGIPDVALAANGSFSFSCTPSNCSGSPVTCQGFTFAAIGANAASGFTYTIDEAGTKATTQTPSGWGPNNTGCWVRDKGGTC